MKSKFAVKFADKSFSNMALQEAALAEVPGAPVFTSVEEACNTVIFITGSTSPGENKTVYEEIYPTYRDLYPALKPIFHR